MLHTEERDDMRKAIAIGLLGLALGSNRAAAQTAVEQDQILRDFQGSVVDYTQRHNLAAFSEAIDAASPPPKIFTLPVAMVFRQLIGRAVATEGSAIVGLGSPTRHPVVMQPFPGSELTDFPKVLADALPVLPAPLEYRLIGHDLAIRDSGTDAIVAVLRDGLGPVTARH
jgi:hypothetical protein